MIKYVLVFLILIFSIFSNEKTLLEDATAKTNRELSQLRNELKRCFELSERYFSEKRDEIEFKELLQETKKIKNEILNVQNEYKSLILKENIKTDEGYSFWDAGETTISQLIMEYGSQDFLYVIPNEIGSLKLNLFSTISIPRESFDEVLKLILVQNGIGVKKINPYLSQLFLLKADSSHIEAIFTKKEELNFFDDTSYLAYILNPPYERLKSSFQFFEKFSDLKFTTIHSVKTQIIIISTKANLERLLDLYDKVFCERDMKTIKIITLNKLNFEEADKIIKAYFLENVQKNKVYYQNISNDEICIIPSGKSSIILIGEEKLVQRAEKIILDLEAQVDDQTEMMVFTYTCEYSDAEELSNILEKLYSSLNVIDFQDSFPIKEKVKTEKKNEKKSDKENARFIVDSKTNSILMVIKKDEKEKIITLIKSLDIPKKMVQIDVLLVERKIQDRKQTGINLLRIGNVQSRNETAINFDSGSNSTRKGLLDFILSRTKSKLPSFDIAMSFLMSKDDMKIADCPSIIAINQTPAVISVVDEISLNNGAVQIDTNSGSKLEKSFSRAQFGTKIILTPTIHPKNELEDVGYITLHTDVSFDTTKSENNDRPSVTRRHIENEVRVADGQTIILGGLRRKTKEEGSEKIPFLGEIPGIGKVFGTNRNSESTTEMFVFITPHIIQSNENNLKQKQIELSKQRQGDILEFVTKLEEAKNNNKLQLFENSLKLFFDK
ncbi:MAG: hypothetical protein A3F40_01230 [Chlamydiae bacterium RIFCSPHIGHO2_12_FULL_27_8]|nr:MAG: hypothetical protein A3F40_01230 [Chlamydiae bacterium RIFCSPHIGHO2_12_FULL_27_8]